MRKARISKLNRDEMVVLCDEDDRELGLALKREVHGSDTPLHRAFSCFLFNEKGEVLVTQRAWSKQTWPGVWSNSFCGHPGPGETREEALVRRAEEELGCKVKDIRKVSDYRYRFERDGVVENEVCPVYVARIAGGVDLNPEEVADFIWVRWDEWMIELERDADGEMGKWTEWCKEEAGLVNEYMGQGFLAIEEN